ncbi:MAG: alpha/beta hydrolase [Dysgonamonadaceae bacterium]|jgi:acetyl esterase/lipase|nr:alpha/beta hydrolase [Dysgonamonadaceae bacterium]
MNKIKLIVCFIIFFALPLYTQTVKIWQGTPSLTKKQQKSELTIYLPEKEKNTEIAVIICPGGSYCYLGMKKEGHDVAKYLQSQGIAAFVLRYRVGMYGNHHPAMIQDLQRAIQWVKEKGDDYQVDTAKVGVMGFSAGGHLAGTAGTYFDTNFMETLGIVPQISLKPAFIAMIYPVITMRREEIVHKKSRRNLLGSNSAEAMRDFMSLEQQVRSNMPPVFLLHCKNDATVNYLNSVCYDEALTQKNVPHQCLFYEEKGHGFGIKPNGKTTGWQQQFVSWVQFITK